MNYFKVFKYEIIKNKYGLRFLNIKTQHETNRLLHTLVFASFNKGGWSRLV